MIWAQLLLLVAVGAMAVYFLRHRRKVHARAYKKLVLIGFLVASLVTILFPDQLTWLANRIGIGRGADLLLYGLALTLLFVILNNHLKEREQQRIINQLARRIAIIEASQHDSDTSDQETHA